MTAAVSRARSRRPGVRDGVPYVWTPGRVEAVAGHLRAGLSFRSACALAGGAERGLREAREREPAVALAIDRALADFERDSLERIADESKASLKGESSGDWKAAAWVLERRMRDEYHLPTKLAGHDGGALMPTRPALTRDEARERVQRALLAIDETAADLAALEAECKPTR